MTGCIQTRLLSLLLLMVFSLTAQAAADYMSPGLTPEQLLEILDTDQAPLIVDVRKPAEYAIGHIPGAINIPLDEIKHRLGEFRQDNGVLL